LVRRFVDEQILPVATSLEHADEYPTKIVEQMQEMGIFGLMIPEEYGGLGEWPAAAGGARRAGMTAVPALLEPFVILEP
jgi:alkylation response protein AidB-like acyl-CoA dehydrogenase